MPLGIGGRKFVAVAHHINQLTGIGIVNIHTAIGVVPLEGKHILIDGIPVEHGGVGFELVTLEQNLGSLVVGDEMAFAGLEVDMGVIVVGGEDELVVLVEVVDTQVGGIGKEFMMFEREPLGGDIGAFEVEHARAVHTLRGKDGVAGQLGLAEDVHRSFIGKDIHLVVVGFPAHGAVLHIGGRVLHAGQLFLHHMLLHAARHLVEEKHQTVGSGGGSEIVDGTSFTS